MSARPVHRWTAEELWSRPDWRIQTPPDIHEDMATLLSWAMDRSAPWDDLEVAELELPRIRTLADRIRDELCDGSGVAWVQSPTLTDAVALRLLFMALGLHMGAPVGAYGRLYDVKDSGRSHIAEAIPVSQTRASTGVHTDSSNRDICPTIVALLCLQPAQTGGGSRVSSALQAHAYLEAHHPRALKLLYGDFARDLVTPGATRTAQTIAENRFPIFSTEPGPLLRYMRLWIERGQREAGEPLSDAHLAALDRLDEALEDPAHVVRFRMEAGHMLFCNNTRVAHDRDAYVHDAGPPRWLCRMWIEPRARAS